MKGIQFEYCILGHYANLLLLILELPIRTEVSLSEAIFSNLTMLNGCINKKVNYEIIWDQNGDQEKKRFNISVFLCMVHG